MARTNQAVTTVVMRALTYTRVSSDEQRKGGISLDAQTAEVRRYATQHCWIIDAEYQDVLTGRRDDRPDYQALLARVRELRAAGQPCVVVVAALDRFGRRMMERVRSREELKSLGVATHSVREGGEVSDLVANVLASVAAEEIERTGQRVKHTWAHAKSLGWFKISNALPWGYTSRPATPEERAAGAPKTVLDIDPLAAPYVTELFDRFAAGESVWSLARWASALPSAVRGSWTLGRGRGSAEREMSRRGVSYLLRNDVYAAQAPARWPALVSPETWARVQAMLDDHRDAPRAQRSVFPLSGLVRCPCGARACGTVMRDLRRYRCQAPRSGGTCAMSFAAASVEGAVYAEVTERLEWFAAASHADLERAWHRLSQADAPDDSKRVRALEQRILLARKRINSATSKFVDDSITKSAYDLLVTDEQAALETAEAELASLQTSVSAPTLPALAEVQALVGGFSVALATADPLAVRNVLALLITSVTPVRIRRGEYRVDIAWTPLGECLASVETRAA